MRMRMRMRKKIKKKKNHVSAYKNGISKNYKFAWKNF